MNKPLLLIVDDDRNTREGLGRALRKNYEIVLAGQADQALDILRQKTVDVMLSDIRMPGMDGIALLQQALARTPHPVCVLMTAYGSIDKAVEAMHHGAADYVTKPYNLDDLEMRLEKALRMRETESENIRLHRELDEKYGLESIIGISGPMLKVFSTIRQVAPTQATVLLEGESGTGKELVAHAIHRLSGRSNGPFVAVNCSALSPNLIESELFGHEKGAFTGAHERRIGRFEMANGGTFFLDEISEIDLATQTKLLRVLEERKFERVGGRDTIDVDMRMIAATNTDIKRVVDKGSFRKDLYFRINVVNIVLPPLRERIDDIPVLCSHFIDEFNEKNGKGIDSITPEAMSMLSSYSWPGNVRELRNTVERMVVLARGKRLTPKDVPPDITNAVSSEVGTAGISGVLPGLVPASMEEAEKMMIVTALKQNGGNRTNAAKQLGISRRTLHRKLKLFQIE